MRNEPINFHTSGQLVKLFIAERSDGHVDTLGPDLDLRVSGTDLFLRVKSEAIFGPGIGWSVRSMGPCEFDDGEASTVTMYSVNSVETFIQAIRHAFGDRQPVIAKDAQDIRGQTFEWRQQGGGGITLGFLRSDGWVARHVAPGEVVACRVLGTASLAASRVRAPMGRCSQRRTRTGPAVR